ncbi:MAG: hypothetical protein WDZ35_06445 [Crocinitomicaceae bacterium]
MKKTSIIIFFGMLLMFSCKKDKLEGDSAILIGEWKWVYSNEIKNTCNPPSYQVNITPNSINSTFKIGFLKKGKVEFFQNGVEQPGCAGYSSCAKPKS